ncbi:polymeric immunoglobulin receptor-like, partial [Colossoma macropomum]|uniref:polymeric immunoglobulin receptor-like n=1 Tax=Colossoma macropomum TaxID=42526 RepID=UPI00186413F2
CAVLSDSERTISRSPGESVLLPCPCPTDQHKINPDRVTWTKDQTAVCNDTESYRGRVWMFNQNHSRNFSLLISDLTKEDSGLYTCRADEKDMPYVQLEVEGCALSENKQTVPVSRSSGESVLLSCTCTDLQDRPVKVQWRTPNHEDLLQRYSGRVQTFDQSSPGNLSVLISDLTEEDGGTYSCWINQNQYRNFSLTVKGCTLSETQDRVIVRSPGESVLLPCSCTDQHTKPVSVKWERVDSGGTEVSNETELYRGRVHMFNKNLPAYLSLLIFNLTEQDQGTYRCSINNKQSINIRLSIEVKSTAEKREITSQSDSSGLLITLSVCVALLLIVVIGESALIYKLIHNRTQGSVSTNTERRTQNTADNDYENGLPKNRNKISMAPIYQSLDPNTNQPDSVYQGLNPNTNQSDSVYQGLNPNTIQLHSASQN